MAMDIHISFLTDGLIDVRVLFECVIFSEKKVLFSVFCLFRYSTTQPLTYSSNCSEFLDKMKHGSAYPLVKRIKGFVSLRNVQSTSHPRGVRPLHVRGT